MNRDVNRWTFLQTGAAAAPLCLIDLHDLPAAEARMQTDFLGHGTMSGEVGNSTTLLQTCLTRTVRLDAASDLPRTAGVVCFEWSLREDCCDAQRTPYRGFLQFTAGSELVFENFTSRGKRLYRAVF